MSASIPRGDQVGARQRRPPSRAQRPASYGPDAQRRPPSRAQRRPQSQAQPETLGRAGTWTAGSMLAGGGARAMSTRARATPPARARRGSGAIDADQACAMLGAGHSRAERLRPRDRALVWMLLFSGTMASTPSSPAQFRIALAHQLTRAILATATLNVAVGAAACGGDVTLERASGGGGGPASDDESSGARGGMGGNGGPSSDAVTSIQAGGVEWTEEGTVCVALGPSGQGGQGGVGGAAGRRGTAGEGASAAHPRARAQPSTPTAPPSRDRRPVRRGVLVHQPR